MMETYPCGSPNGMLLPCNLEQLNDRINNLSAGLIGMGEKETIRVSRTFLTEVLNYMEELLGLRRAAPARPRTCAGCESEDSEEMCEHCSRALRNDLYRCKPMEEGWQE